MSFLTMLDEIKLESLMKEKFECFIEYYRENNLEDYKSDLENLKEVYKMMNGGVEYPRTQNASPSEIKEPYEPSPRMYSYEQPSCLGSNFIGETLSKSDQLHQTFEKSSIAMTLKLEDMIELPKSQPKRTNNEDLKCKIVMVKMPKCMAWLDDKPIGDLDTMEDKEKSTSSQINQQVLPSFEVYTPTVTHPEEVEETIEIPIEEITNGNLRAGIFEEKKKSSSLQTLEIASGLILTASPGRKSYLLEDKQITSVEILEEIHMTWAYLEKKRTRLQLYTKSLKKLCIQSVETVSHVTSDGVRTFEVTLSEI
nr:hypothetical protein [Tanacetum cinerariifolium]